MPASDYAARSEEDTLSEHPPIRIPARAAPVMSFLAGLDDAERAELLAAFTTEPVATSVDSLRARVDAAIKGGEASRHGRDLIRELFGLTSLATSHGYSVEGVSTAVAVSERLELEEPERESFESFLRALLQSSAVRTLGKAVDLAREHERILHLVRIITDLTPIFEEPDDEPVGGLVMHRLRLSYWTVDGESDTEISLSTSQLAELGAAVTRAQTKADSMQRVLGKMSLPSFKTDGEN